MPWPRPDDNDDPPVSIYSGNGPATPGTGNNGGITLPGNGGVPTGPGAGGVGAGPNSGIPSSYPGSAQAPPAGSGGQPLPQAPGPGPCKNPNCISDEEWALVQQREADRRAGLEAKNRAAAAGPAAPRAAAGGGAAIPSGDDAESKMILDYLKRVMGGELSRYSPAVVEDMKTDLFRTTEGRRRAAEDRVESDAVARGLYRSGILSRRKGEIERGAAADYSGGVRAINREKAIADFEDKMGALDRTQKWLDSRRQYVLGLQANANQKEAAMAQIALGYAKIAADKEMLQMQMSKMGGGGGGSNPFQDFMQQLSIMDMFSKFVG